MPAVRITAGPAIDGGNRRPHHSPPPMHLVLQHSLCSRTDVPMQGVRGYRGETCRRCLAPSQSLSSSSKRPSVVTKRMTVPECRPVAKLDDFESLPARFNHNRFLDHLTPPRAVYIVKRYSNGEIRKIKIFSQPAGNISAPHAACISHSHRACEW